MDKKHIGSVFDDLIRDERLLDNAEAVAAKRVIALLTSPATQLRLGSAPPRPALPSDGQPPRAGAAGLPQACPPKLHEDAVASAGRRVHLPARRV